MGKYACAMLCGGRGRRLGNIDKSQLEYKGMSFESLTVEKLESTGLKCYISCAAYEHEAPEGWTLVKDCVFDEKGEQIGPMGGIYSCLLKAQEDGYDGLFFVPCDAPLFKATTIRLMEEQIRPDTLAAVWRTPDGKRQPTFGYYSTELIPVIEKSIEDGFYRIGRVIELADALILSAKDAGIDDSEFRNINFMEDYRALVEGR